MDGPSLQVDIASTQAQSGGRLSVRGEQPTGALGQPPVAGHGVVNLRVSLAGEVLSEVSWPLVPGRYLLTGSAIPAPVELGVSRNKFCTLLA
jgi:hypothetical protein